ncbi:MAG: hypothetical protein AAGB12_05530 [Pseudomonadota bacterium]
MRNIVPAVVLTNVCYLMSHCAYSAEDSWCDRYLDGPATPHVYCDHQKQEIPLSSSRKPVYQAKRVANEIVRGIIEKEIKSAKETQGLASQSQSQLTLSCYVGEQKILADCQPACQKLNKKTGEWQQC